MAESIFSSSELAPDLFRRDYEACLAFYRDTSGLKVEEIPQMPGNAVIHAGHGTKLGLHSSDRASTPDHTTASLLVDDVGSAIDYLRSKGVELEDYDLPEVKTVDGVATWGSFKAAWFKDPEGNILCVSPSYEAMKKSA